MALQPPFYDPPIADYPSGQQHSQAWTEYHQAVSDRLALVDANVGVSSGGEAPAGQVGEYKTVSLLAGSAVGLGNLAAASVTHLDLTPGDWEIWGNVVFQPAGTTTVNVLAAWINSVAAAVPGTLESEGYVSMRATFTTGQHQALAIGRVRLLNSATQTMHLNVLAGFGVSSMAAYGVLNARRTR